LVAAFGPLFDKVGLMARFLYHLIPFFFFISSLDVAAMGFSNPLKTCVFSAVRARLVIEGEPVKGATVIRRWEWQTLREERTVTDDEGYFDFPAKFEYSILRLLPAEIVIGQGLYVVIDNEENAFWIYSRRSPEENAEYQGRPIDIMCDLNDETVVIKDSIARMVTLCN
jgi:hypothetical protein